MPHRVDTKTRSYLAHEWPVADSVPYRVSEGSPCCSPLRKPNPHRRRPAREFEVAENAKKTRSLPLLQILARRPLLFKLIKSPGALFNTPYVNRLLQPPSQDRKVLLGSAATMPCPPGSTACFVALRDYFTVQHCWRSALGASFTSATLAQRASRYRLPFSSTSAAHFLLQWS